MMESFRLGGWGMFPTAFFGILLFAAAVKYALEPHNRWIPLQAALGVLTLVSGGLGFVTGLIATTTHLEGVARGDVGVIAAAGFGESLHNLSLALILLAFAVMATSIGAARLVRNPDLWLKQAR